MIINIPLNIPEEMLENTIAKDYEAKITENLTNEVRKILANHDEGRYYYGSGKGKDERRGLEDWVSQKVDNYISQWKDEIIEAAADKLAERLARTKAAKELIQKQID